MIDIRRIQQLPPIQQGVGGSERNRPQEKIDFAQILERANKSQSELRFSAHALERMEQRGIEITPAELEQIQNAVKAAADKGARSSLVLLDERAFVVSVANNVVITAMEGESMKDQMITDIDSAVIL